MLTLWITIRKPGRITWLEKSIIALFTNWGTFCAVVMAAMGEEVIRLFLDRCTYDQIAEQIKAGCMHITSVICE
jgi:L-cysteine desulfidase